jgi:hypothetical protein
MKASNVAPFVSVNLTSDEWVRIHNAAGKQWPKETLSRGEICRRYVLYGMESLKNVSPEDQSRLAHSFQASMEANDARLKH